MKYILKPALTLFAIAAIITAMLSLVRGFTLERIERQRRVIHERVMREALSEADSFRDIPIESGTSENIIGIYEGLKGGMTMGYVIELAPSGYSGEINMMVGISSEREALAGMRILRHSETPGLGALAVREEFFRRFDGVPLLRLRVVRSPPSGDDEIQAITGATITSNAVTGAVNEAIEWYVKTHSRNTAR